MSAPLVVGTTVRFGGMVGPLIWSGARSPRDVERSLGFGAGRLGAGYFLLLLKEPLRADDIQFDGTSLQSGGRWGLPTADAASDALRPAVSKTIDPHTASHWGKKMSGTGTQLRGTDRLSKIVPITRHSTAVPPNQQYPQGGGGGQWTLKKDYEFLVAMFVDASAMANTASPPGLRASVADGAPYDGRARLARYLTAA